LEDITMSGQTLAPSDRAIKPAHIPDSLVYDFDMFTDPALLRAPHSRVTDLLKNAPPIFWTPRNGGRWVLLSYAANFDAARDVEIFSSEMMPQKYIQEMLALMPEGSPRIPQPFPINLDPPLHGKYRAPLQRAFSPKTIDAMRTDIRNLAVKLIEQVSAQGHCEFMHAIAEPLPVIVFLDMFGLPEERLAEYRTLIKKLMASADSSDGSALPYLIQIVQSIRGALLQRRDDRRDDLISLLWSTEIDGKPITLDDLENYGLLLFIAGLDTVMNGMGLGVCHLAQDQELQSKLRLHPELIPDAVEELLRRYSFVVPRRRIDKDTIFHGVEMKKDEVVLLFLPSADLDSAEFPDAEKVDLDREKKSHIVFNAGPHRCLGSHLARLEMNILYEELLSRLPPFKLDPTNKPVYHGGPVIGLDTLHLVWDE